MKLLSSHLVHVLQLCILIGLWRMAFMTIITVIVLILTLNLHLNLFALAILLVTFLDEDASSQLFCSCRRREVAWRGKKDAGIIMQLQFTITQDHKKCFHIPCSLGWKSTVSTTTKSCQSIWAYATLSFSFSSSSFFLSRSWNFAHSTRYFT